MISVVIILQLLDNLLGSQLVSFGEHVDVFRHLREQFFLGDAANAGVFSIHGNVGDVVLLAEDAELGELGDTCEEDELQHRFAGFQGTVEITHDVTEHVEAIFVVCYVE